RKARPEYWRRAERDRSQHALRPEPPRVAARRNESAAFTRRLRCLARLAAALNLAEIQREWLGENAVFGALERSGFCIAPTGLASRIDHPDVFNSPVQILLHLFEHVGRAIAGR